jgi:hypothetical protein
MGLIDGFSKFLTPGVYSVRNDGLPSTIIDVDVVHDLLMTIGHPVKRFYGRPALRLRLEGQPHVAISCINIFTHVECRPPRHLCEYSIEGSGLSRQHLPLAREVTRCNCGTLLQQGFECFRNRQVAKAALNEISKCHHGPGSGVYGHVHQTSRL